MIKDVFCCFKKVGWVVFFIICNNSLQEKDYEAHDIVIEYKAADYEPADTNHDDYSIIESKDDTIPHIDDNVSEFTLEDVGTEQKQESAKKDEKVRPGRLWGKSFSLPYLQNTEEDDFPCSPEFLQLSVSGLREVVGARKKVDQRKEGNQDLKKMHQLLTMY